MNQEKTYIDYLIEFEAKQLKEELAAVKIAAVWRGYAARELATYEEALAAHGLTDEIIEETAKSAEELTDHAMLGELEEMAIYFAASKLAAVWRGYAVRHLPRGRKRSAEAISPAAKRRKYLTMDPEEGLTFRKYAGMSAEEVEAASMETFAVGDTVKVYDQIGQITQKLYKIEGQQYWLVQGDQPPSKTNPHAGTFRTESPEKYMKKM